MGRRSLSFSEQSEDEIQRYSGDFSNIDLQVSKNKCIRILNTKCMSLETSKCHSSFKCTGEENGEDYMLHRYIFDLKDDNNKSTTFNIQLESRLNELKTGIEKYMNFSNPGIVNYVGYKILFNSKVVIIFMLQPFIKTTPLSDIINENVVCSETFLKYVAVGVLKSLKYLKDNGITHGALKDSCIFMNSSIHNHLRISDYIENLFLHFLSDLLKSSKVNEFNSSVEVNHGNDLKSLGIILLSLIKSKEKLNEEIPEDVNIVLKNLLEICLSGTATVDKLISHSFINLSVTNNDVNKNKIGMANPDGTINSESSTVQSSNSQIKSRLMNEYIVGKTIGKGGFGRVLKVTGKLENEPFAVKVIKLDCKPKYISHIVKEAQTLSILNHENVVRYFFSWIETFEECSDGFSSESSSDSEPEEIEQKQEVKNILKKKTATFSDMSEFTFEKKKKSVTWADLPSRKPLKDNTSSGGIVFEESEKKKQESEKADLKVEEKESEKEEKRERRTFPPNYLYIKMEFCENKTLSQAIEENLYMHEILVEKYLRNIINGLKYIHHLDIVHRDLKPGNIFIDINDSVKIGDFGLASVVKLIQPVNRSKTSDSSGMQSSNRAAGTYYYRAPELDKEDCNNYCTTKLDMYSLGIIFYEMTSKPAQTGQERNKNLMDLRKSEIIIPESYRHKADSKNVQLIKWLLSHSPKDRPSADELSKCPLIPSNLGDALFKSKVENELLDVNSKMHDSILQKLFTARKDNSQYLKKVKEENNRWIHMDRIINQLETIFKSFGAEMIATSSVMCMNSHFLSSYRQFPILSPRGNSLQFCSDLLNPFAYLISLKNFNSIRRYFINRIQTKNKLKPDYPVEKHHCLFDIVSDENLKFESCSRILLVAHEVFNYLAQINEVFKEKIYVEFYYLPLTKCLLDACSIPEQYHESALEIIEWEVRKMSSSNSILKKLQKKLNIEISGSLKSLLGFSGTVEDFQTELDNTFHQHENNEVIKTKFMELCSILRVTEKVLNLSNFQYDYKPLKVIRPSTFTGFAFRFLSKKFHKQLLIEGGDYTSLVMKYQSNFPQSNPSKERKCAVGMQINLEVLVEYAFTNFSNGVPSTCYYENIGCGRGKPEVIIAYVGSKVLSEETFLRERIELVYLLRSSTAIDFISVKNEDPSITKLKPNIVAIYSEKDLGSVTVRYSWNEEKNYWMNERKVPFGCVLNYLEYLIALNQEEVEENLQAPFCSSTDGDEFVIEKCMGSNYEANLFDQEVIIQKAAAYLKKEGYMCLKGFRISIYPLEMNSVAISVPALLDFNLCKEEFEETFRNMTDCVEDFPESLALHLYDVVNVYKANSEYSRIFMAYSIQSDCFVIFYQHMLNLNA